MERVLSQGMYICNTELQITFYAKGYLPPDFELNADFQISVYFHPLYFFAMLKIDDITFQFHIY